MTDGPKETPEKKDELPPISQAASGDDLQFSLPAPKIEGYEILEKLAEAGQGQVWKAVQLSTSRKVALKVPRFQGVGSKKAFLRFEREVQVAARLKHPHIARIYDTGINRGLYYYAMELVDGQHLDTYVKDRNLSQKQVLELFKKICLAVQYAHQNAVIHRDLKPSNIIVSQDGQPHIVDFGLAKGLQEDDIVLTMTQDAEAAGTPAFMSPEQASGRHDGVDIRTDIYSLGAVLYCLLTGKYPHGLSGNRYQVLKRIAEEDIRKPKDARPDLDKELEYILVKALAQDPERRYSGAGEFAQDIDNFLAGNPLIAGPESIGYVLRKVVVKHKIAVLISIGFLFLIISSLAVFFYLYLDAEKQRKTAEDERQHAKQALVEANKLSYCNTIQNIQAKLRLNNRVNIRKDLLKTDPLLRDWEWGYLMNQCSMPTGVLKTNLKRIRIFQPVPEYNNILIGTELELGLWDTERKKQLWKKDHKRAGNMALEVADPVCYNQMNDHFVILRETDLYVVDRSTGNTVFKSSAFKISTFCTTIMDTFLYVGTFEGKILKFDLNTFSFTHILTIPDKIDHIAADPKSPYMVFYDGEYTCVYELKTNQLKYKIRKLFNEGIQDLCIIAKKNELITVQDSGLYIYSLDSGQLINKPEMFKVKCWIVAKTQNEGYLAASCEDGTLKIYDTAIWTKAYEFKHDYSVFNLKFISHHVLYSACEDAVIKKWDLQQPSVKSNIPINDITLKRAGTYKVRYRPDGKVIAIRNWSLDEKTMVYDMATQEKTYIKASDTREHVDGERVRFVDFRPRSCELVIEDADELNFYDTQVTPCAKVRSYPLKDKLADAAFSEDGRVLIISYKNKNIELFDLAANSTMNLTLEKNTVCNVMVGQANDSLIGYNYQYGIIYWWDFKSGKLKNTFNIPNHIPKLRSCFSLHPVKKIIAVHSGLMGEISIMDFSEGKLLNILTGYNSSEVEIQFSKSGKRLFSGSTNRTLIVWDWVIGRPLLTFEEDWYVISLRVSPDGHSILTNGIGNPSIAWIKTAMPWKVEELPGTPDMELEERCSLWRSNFLFEH